MSLYESQSHQEIARQRHAQVIRNATIRYAAKPSYEPKEPARVEQQAQHAPRLRVALPAKPSGRLAQAFHGIAPALHRVEERQRVSGVPRRERELHLGLGDRELDSLAVVLDRDEVDTLLRDS